MPVLEYTGHIKKLCCFLLLLRHRAVNVVHRFLINTPLNVTWLPICRFHFPTLLETRSQQGLGMYSVRIWRREPLRSASRLLGAFPFCCSGILATRLWRVVDVDLRSFRIPENLSGSFLAWHIVGSDL